LLLVTIFGPTKHRTERSGEVVRRIHNFQLFLNEYMTVYDTDQQ